MYRRLLFHKRFMEGYAVILDLCEQAPPSPGKLRYWRLWHRFRFRQATNLFGMKSAIQSLFIRLPRDGCLFQRHRDRVNTQG